MGKAPPIDILALLLDPERLAALKSLGIVDTGPEETFEDAVGLASAICGTPISLVSLLDGERQWFKARIGLDASETPQEQAFCAYAIGRPELFIVPDAKLDDRFSDNPLVTGDPRIRFYAGMPLHTRGGHAIGTLCVIDTVPRELTSEQKSALVLLARQVANQINLRIQMQHMSDLIAENSLFTAFMENSPLVSFMKDEEGHLLYYNRLFAERFGINGEEWLGKLDAEIWPPVFAGRFRSVDLEVLSGGKLVVTEETSPGANNTLISWRTYKFPFLDQSNKRFLAGMSIDVSVEREAERRLADSHAELNAANARLRELSLTDPLTGLFNRRAFDDRLYQEIASSSRHGVCFSMLLFDVDNFRALNDAFSHKEGDNVLRQLSTFLQTGARISDVVCRYGGEEFAVLLSHTSVQAATLLADRIRELIQNHSWQPAAVTVSAGVSTSTASMTDGAAVVRQAVVALAAAKTLGRNRVVTYNPELEDTAG